MSLSSWLSRRPKRDHEIKVLEQEKRELLQELAHASVTFERRRYRVHEIAEQAIKSMREGQSR
ncbi:hypothetical protein RJJ65_17660 [Rhizobium hidalgonense]|uniref:Uncharacterized protein n=1 Tax=Rhizobium hidalgonense TaxID=1538159 RepID=A0AAJ2GWP8_9HYPH|nr:hypothetical protein [Rhizobium hidalgonense]MDR9774458.1 hypothetical protein [Rhizobium hidalgonense]MDR9809556.1 hypothetical protein [Rhizobium hidalgonense]